MRKILVGTSGKKTIAEGFLRDGPSSGLLIFHSFSCNEKWDSVMKWRWAKGGRFETKGTKGKSV